MSHIEDILEGRDNGRSVAAPPGTVLSPPDALLAELKAIREHLEDLHPHDSSGVRRESQAGADAWAQVTIPTDALLTDDVREIGIQTHTLRVLNWPDGLTTLNVRLNDPARQAFDILRDGTKIRSDVPIDKIFVTTVPAIAGGRIRILGGNTDIEDEKCGLQNVCYTTSREHGCGMQDRAVPGVDMAGLGNPCIVAHAHTFRTTAGTSNMFANIPANQPWRVRGRVIAFFFSTNIGAGLTAFRIDVNEVAGSTWQFSPIDQFVPGAGTLVFPYDTGWVRHTEATEVDFRLAILGPAGQYMAADGQIFLGEPG